MKDLVLTILVLLIVGAGGYAAYRYYNPPMPELKQSEAVPIPDAPQLRKVKKVSTPVKQVETFVDEAKKELKLPPAVIADADVKVIDATKVDSNDHPVTVTSTLNTQTGKIETFIKEEPLPWIAFNQRGQVRLATGYRVDPLVRVPQRITRLTAQHDFMQTKALNLGVEGSIDSDGRTFVGGSLSYRW